MSRPCPQGRSPKPPGRKYVNVTRRTLLLAIATLATVGIAASPASATRASLSPDAATALMNSLGEARTGGTYLEAASGAVVVTVTDAAAATSVRTAGGRARLVSR